MTSSVKRIDGHCSTHEGVPFFEDEGGSAFCPLCEYLSDLGVIRTMRETNARLNRRCQQAESAALENVKACVGAGLSFSRTLANWYALRLAEELRLCLPMLERLVDPKQVGLDAVGPQAEEFETHRQRIVHALPDAQEMVRWHSRQVQPKASSRDA